MGGLQAIGRWWLVWEFGDDTMSDKQACIDAYLAHNAHIKATVPPERLLVCARAGRLGAAVQVRGVPFSCNSLQLCYPTYSPDRSCTAIRGRIQTFVHFHEWKDHTFSAAHRLPVPLACAAQPGMAVCMHEGLEWRTTHVMLRSFLGVPEPETPFPRCNEGANEMAWQIVRFIVRNPLSALGLYKYVHKGPLDFDTV